MPKYTPKQVQIKFPKVTPDELARKIHDKLNGDYALYEIRDFLDVLGESIKELLLDGRTVPIKKLGTFTLHYNRPREYVDVTKQAWMQSYGTITPKFKYTLETKHDISKTIKGLLVSTMKQPPDAFLRYIDGASVDEVKDKEN